MAPRVGTGSPSVPQKLSLVSTRCSTKTPQRFSDAETTGIASKMTPAVTRKKRVMSPSDDTTPYASEGVSPFFFQNNKLQHLASKYSANPSQEVSRRTRHHHRVESDETTCSCNA